MALTPEQIEHIERLKRELGIDQGLGKNLSDQTRRRGNASGIDPISAGRGREIVEENFNPIIIGVIEDSED